ncbi:MAG: hypothetical protein SPC25_04050, partial [Atopobiaceae bacterium]|nr:hypothetical protein [Atopobiaceae bacterium]
MQLIVMLTPIRVCLDPPFSTSRVCRTCGTDDTARLGTNSSERRVADGRHPAQLDHVVVQQAMVGLDGKV